MKIVIRSIVTIMMMISLISPVNANSSINEQVLQHVNQERANLGRKALRIDAKLSTAAAKRSQEIVQTFSHTRPNGKEWSTIYDDFNIFPLYIGENVAKKSYNKVPDNAELAQDFYTLWKNSPGHYQNMVKPEYDMIGLSIHKVGNVYYMTQLFNSDGAEKPQTSKPQPKPEKKKELVIKEEIKPTHIPTKDKRDVPLAKEIPKKDVKEAKVDQQEEELANKQRDEIKALKLTENQLKFEQEQVKLQQEVLFQQEKTIKKQKIILIGLIASIVSLVMIIIYVYIKK
ncbi:CAP domain-containing protein [Erysipelothrix urinaevulpis]|uniref:CAP domain-containing protein n=1 Tax=Erysipelothrix urinaevulpis TaxID=2683717 RepID=UPI00135855E1|nr:CAP domain-containing protein [Erysipelothrix urinaevulpis]